MCVSVSLDTGHPPLSAYYSYYTGSQKRTLGLTKVLDPNFTGTALIGHLRVRGTRRRLLGVIIAANYAPSCRYTSWPL